MNNWHPLRLAALICNGIGTLLCFMDLLQEIRTFLAFSTFVREARMRGISIMNVQFESDDTTTDGKLGFICTLRSVKRSEHGRIILTVRSISDGITIDEL